MIGRFFKIGLFFYAAVLGLSHVFKLKNPSPLVFSIGLVVLFYSLSLAQNYFEHVYEGLKIGPFTLHFPVQIVIPALLLVITFLRNRKNLPSATMKKTAENSSYFHFSIGFNLLKLYNIGKKPKGEPL
ncbi:GerAB/ArcD/ProY family transporter [Priestia aryabhattai]|uniref:GerAB/ArcD/ProY family transporter n=1 Tax=Priestia megaterium TaxID=1404 RepID=UPI0039B88E92